MPRTIASQAPYASASLAVGGGTVSGSFLPINYGVSINLKITNGATGPTAAALAIVEVADDAAGTNAGEVFRAPQGDLAANAVNLWPYSLAPFGGGGDWSHYRVRFVAPTGQAVTVAAQASTTTAIT